MVTTKITVVLLVVVLIVGAGIGYGAGFTVYQQQLSDVKSELLWTQIQYDQLEVNLTKAYENITSLRDALKISLANLDTAYAQGYEDGKALITLFTPDGTFKIYDLRIEGWYNGYYKGKITNLSDKTFLKVYVYAILHNPDGTSDFSSYDYDILEHVAPNETMEFEISCYPEPEQNVEILIIY